MTAHYNILHNGMESFKEGEKSLMQNNRNNYTAILNLFPYSGDENAGKVRAEMDRAISKGQKLIHNKSIKAKPKRKPGRNNSRYTEFYNQREFNRLVDEAYMLIGKAHLYNHNFNEALHYFDFTTREFPNSPVRFDALIWTARTRIEMGDLDNAILLLNQYDAMGKAPNRLYGEFMATYADYLIHKGQYEAAIPFMVKAAEYAQGKWNKSRRNFILAQLYQQAGQYQMARERYLKVARSNPEYEMNLNARLNLAIIDGHLGHNTLMARKALLKMLRQSKNQEFRDRIYYILAQSFLSEGDTLTAITNLQLSSGYNANSKELKTETYLQMASLNFDVSKYVPSYSYYDSTLMVMDEGDKRFTEIKKRHSALQELAKNYIIIFNEDSVRSIAAMPVGQRDAFLNNLIEARRLSLTQQTSAQSLNQGNPMAEDPLFYQNYASHLNRQTDSQGQWYFYNPTTVSLGKMDFERRWGKRTSEDNWRRSDKGTASQISDLAPPGPPSVRFLPPELFVSSKNSQIPGDPGNESELPDIEEMINGLPLTPEQKAESDHKLAKARFDAGMVFFNQFEDYRKASEMFKKVVADFPGHPIAEQAWFWAFRCFAALGNKSGMEKMKTGLMVNFPNSRFTAFVSDPDYQEKRDQKTKELNNTYETAYVAYVSNNYNQVLTKTGVVLSTGDEDELLRKSHLLRAVTHGKMGNNKAFENELQQLVTNHNKSSEGMLAAKWLEMLKIGRQPVISTASVKSADSKLGKPEMQPKLESSELNMLKFQPDSLQQIILIVNSESDINRLLFNIADYNFNRFLLADFEIDIKKLPDGQNVMTVGQFKNRLEVMDYFFSIRENTNLFRVENIGNPSIFAGSDSNLKTLVSSGDISGYRKFFSENYLSGSEGTMINPGLSKPENNTQTTPGKPAFTVSNGVHLAMVVASARADRTRVSSFLTNHALNNFRLRVSVKTEPLKSGDLIVIIESFENLDMVLKFFTSLENNYFWNTQLGARDWKKTAISPNNMVIVKESGTVNEYVKFFDENYLKK